MVEVPSTRCSARGRVGYKHVPSFRCATPPRERGETEPVVPKSQQEPSIKETTIAPPTLCSESLPGASNAVSSTVTLPDVSTPLNSSPVLLDDTRDDTAASSNAPLVGSSALSAEKLHHDPDDGIPSYDVSSEVMQLLAQAYDEGTDEASNPKAGLSGFRWTGVVDAAQAAWIGGTRLLQYGELLPGGVEKAYTYLCKGSLGDPSASSDAPMAKDRQLVLELGMGRGRVALQLFLSGATVIGVELASERYGLGVAALERLAHRFPQDFEISRRTATAVRIRRRKGPKGALCEFRLGNFFNCVTKEEIGASTLMFVQVCLPQAVWPRLQKLVQTAHEGCRLLTYEDMNKVVAQMEPKPLTYVGSIRLACTWNREKGHRFNCYQCMGYVDDGDDAERLAEESRVEHAGASDRPIQEAGVTQ